MIKLQLVARAGADTPAAHFAAAVLERAASRILEMEPRRLKVTLTREDPPRLSVIPFSRRRIAVVSLWTDAAADDASAAAWAAPLAEELGVEAHAYRVEETIPRAYERDWPDGETTPGVELLTLFDRRPGLSDEEFTRRWFGRHTPLSFQIHPLWGYIRNFVEAPLAGAPPLDAIVEEHFRARRDLLSPVVFFGGALRMVPNMARVAEDIRRFIRLRSMETYLASEVHLRG